MSIATSEGLTVDHAILRERTLRLREVGDYLPTGRRGKRLSLSAALRWVLNGVILSDGRRVRLEAVRCGGKWITSLEALERLAAAQTPRLDGDPVPPPRNPAARRRASERAAKELEQAGI
jgi:hypothetical protein